jgi:hypothetical protein
VQRLASVLLRRLGLGCYYARVKQMASVVLRRLELRC